MPKILVLFYSRTGNTAALADAVAEGARSVRFAEVDVRRIDDLAPASVIASVPDWARSREMLAARYQTFADVNTLADYDALILGAPTRYGVMGAELKNVIDGDVHRWEPLRRDGHDAAGRAAGRRSRRGATPGKARRRGDRLDHPCEVALALALGAMSR
jgi:multimeric flavodoxin WrbA